jgi:hypothetical protein
MSSRLSHAFLTDLPDRGYIVVLVRRAQEPDNADCTNAKVNIPG